GGRRPDPGRAKQVPRAAGTAALRPVHRLSAGPLARAGTQALLPAGPPDSTLRGPGVGFRRPAGVAGGGHPHLPAGGEPNVHAAPGLEHLDLQPAVQARCRRARLRRGRGPLAQRQPVRRRRWATWISWATLTNRCPRPESPSRRFWTLLVVISSTFEE